MVRKSSPSTKQIRRLSVTQAKAKLSELLRDASQGPTVIHNRGRDLAVVLAIEDYERLTAAHQSPKPGGYEFLRRVKALKERHGDGVGDFEPARLDFEPVQLMD